MFVVRWTWTPKAGCVDAFVALLNEAKETFPRPHGVRLYVCTIGDSFEAVAQEVEWESWDERDRVWGETVSMPEWAPFLEKLDGLLESKSSVSNEVWGLE